MKDFYRERYKKYFKVPYSVIEEKAKELCKQYGIITSVEEIVNDGMAELFDENGILLEQYAKEKLEYGKNAGMFGDVVLENTWASHLGD